jgi:hypothetical protein
MKLLKTDPVFRGRTRLLRMNLCVVAGVSLTFLLICTSISQSAETISPHARSAGQGAYVLRVLPQDVLMRGAGASQRFVVLAEGPDGIEQDVTAKAALRSSDPSVVRIDSEGRAVALKDGKVVLTATLSGVKARAVVGVRDSQSVKQFSFARDIGGIFTKNGCNSSVCHGGVKGKGGFKLSLDALHPQDDYKWIVEGGKFQVLSAEPGGERKPRIDLKDPQSSLLLLKPTFSVPHGGGQRFSKDSADYRTILAWVKAGTPFGEPDKDPVERIEVLPGDVVLLPKAQHRLVIMAQRASGAREDITGSVLFETADPDVATISADGVLQGVNKGETAVHIRAVGRPASIRVAVITTPKLKFPKTPHKNFIDDYVFSKLEKFNIIPSELSSDAEFLRRVCLDLTGTLPPAERVRQFLASKDPEKRDKIIELLLNTPEYDDFWTFRLSELFRVGGGPVDGPMYWDWVRHSVVANKPYDQIARERIAAEGYDGPSRHYIYAAKVRPLENVVAEEIRLFLGRRLDCAQCHNHPYDTWSQDQFWGLAAFFAKSTTTDWVAGQLFYDDPDGNERDWGEDGITSLRFMKVIHPRTKKEVLPTYPDGQVLPPSDRNAPRMALAKWVTANPWFAEATVNRMWGYFFSRGIVNPVDDFSVTNPATNAPLLTALARDFEAHGYDLKYLFRLITESRAYQASSMPNDSNRDDAINFSHSVPRPLQAEVLLDAISAATGVPEFYGPENTVPSSKGAALPRARAILMKSPGETRFLQVYGRSLRETLPEGYTKANLSQALHLLVGSTYIQKTSDPDGRVDRLINRASDREIIETLYLDSLSRFPTAAEQARLEGMITERPRAEALRDLMWALISSREFAFNH